MNGNTYDISSIKRVSFWKFQVIVRAKQTAKKCTKRCAARAKLLLLIRPIVAFHRFPALHAFAAYSITRFYILFEQTINIIEGFAF